MHGSTDRSAAEVGQATRRAVGVACRCLLHPSPALTNTTTAGSRSHVLRLHVTTPVLRRRTRPSVVNQNNFPLPTPSTLAPKMLFRSLRASGAVRSATRNLHSSSPRLDTASSAKNAAEGASKQLSNIAERAKTLSKPLVERANSMTGGG